MIVRTGRIGSEGNVYDVLCHDRDDKDLHGSLIACLGATTNRNPMTGLRKYEGGSIMSGKKGLVHDDGEFSPLSTENELFLCRKRLRT